MNEVLNQVAPLWPPLPSDLSTYQLSTRETASHLMDTPVDNVDADRCPSIKHSASGAVRGLTPSLVPKLSLPTDERLSSAHSGSPHNGPDGNEDLAPQTGRQHVRHLTTTAQRTSHTAQQTKPRAKISRTAAAPRLSSLCATHPSQYGPRSTPKTPPKTHRPTQKKSTSSPRTLPRPLPASRQQHVSQPPTRLVADFADPNWSIFTENGLPPRWGGRAMLSNTDYDTTFGSVFSPTYVHGLPFGSVIEVAQLYVEKDPETEVA